MTDKLMEQIAAPENLLSDWRVVRGNIPQYRRKKAAGPDGVTLAEFERELQPQLAALREMLLRGRYYPVPPARFKLPKRGGGERVIAVLPIRERVAQRAAQQVLEPLWEPEFLPCSFGFRPGISIEQAVTYVHELRQQGERWAVDGDISTCFDSMDHDLLLTQIRVKIHDGRVLKLIQNWLDAGLLQAGPPTEADPQAAIQAHQRQKFVKEGVNWVLESVAGEGLDEADYSVEDDSTSLPRPLGGRFQPRNYLGLLARRTLVSTVMLGPGLIRPYAEGAAAKTVGALRGLVGTPAGRRLLKSSSLVAGGLAGAAALAALAAYFLNHGAGAAPVGVLQGSPLSPLLANIYLHPFDLALTRSGYHLARFADDWVITASEQGGAERSYNEALKALAHLRLKVNPKKTRILQPEEQLEWLGVVIP
jgi:RNA-directed DNA polymerase